MCLDGLQCLNVVMLWIVLSFKPFDFFNANPSDQIFAVLDDISAQVGIAWLAL